LSHPGESRGIYHTVLAENLVVLMIVEVVDRDLLASSGRVQRCSSDAEFPSCRASRPGCYAGRDHRIAPSIDGVATKPKTKTTCPQSRRSMLVGLVVSRVVGLAFRADHGQA
jgi:hypothetical protein